MPEPNVPTMRRANDSPCRNIAHGLFCPLLRGSAKEPREIEGITA